MIRCRMMYLHWLMEATPSLDSWGCAKQGEAQDTVEAAAKVTKGQPYRCCCDNRDVEMKMCDVRWLSHQHRESSSSGLGAHFFQITIQIQILAVSIYNLHQESESGIIRLKIQIQIQIPKSVYRPGLRGNSKISNDLPAWFRPLRFAPLWNRSKSGMICSTFKVEQKISNPTDNN